MNEWEYSNAIIATVSVDLNLWKKTLRSQDEQSLILRFRFHNEFYFKNGKCDESHEQHLTLYKSSISEHIAQSEIGPI